jgi:uncharacterized iron-regulated membrane protein
LARFRKWLILSHRYLGLGLGLLFVVWFASGIGMIYARDMPRLTDELHLERMEPLDLGSVQLTPLEAAERAGLGESMGSVTLLMVMDRPAYRLGGRDAATIFADTGERMAGTGPERAREVAARFMDVDLERVEYEELLTQSDQWTISLRGQLPFHKLSIDDDRGTRLYVSPESGEVTQLTTRASRALAWVSAIPHWLYFTPLRVRQNLWTQTVLWTAGLGCVLAILGITLGVVQFRASRPFRLSRIRSYIPYAGWMRWHYITGIVFGVLALTWVFSGFLSMEPFGWAAGEGLRTGELRRALVGGPLDASGFPRIDGEAWDDLLPGRSIKEITYARILGEAYFVVRSTETEPGGVASSSQVARGSTARPTDASRSLVSAETLEVRREPFAVDSLMARVRETYPDVAIVEFSLLEEYDSYHYSRDGQAPLPILRVKFDDPDQTWLYIDPRSGRLSTSAHRLDRVERWIYHGFHSLDFSFWYYNRPVWDIAVIVLSLGGLATTSIGLYVGIRRLWRARPRRTPPLP